MSIPNTLFFNFESTDVVCSLKNWNRFYLTVAQTNAMNESSSMDQLRMPMKMEKDYEPVEVCI